MSKHKIAVVGAGKMALEHCRVYAELANVELAGICSRTAARAAVLAKKFGIRRVSEGIAELWEDTKADVVLITVNELSMLPVVREAARFPWTLFLEKPAGYNLEVASEVRATIKQHGRDAYVGLNRRYNAASIAASEALKGCDGPRYIVVNDQQNLAHARSLNHPGEVVRYMMYANSIHLIDYIRVFGRGQVERVERLEDWRGEDSFMQAATMFLSSGDVARYEALWQGPGPWACSISCHEKRLEMRPLETLSVQLAGSRVNQQQEFDPIDAQFKPGFYRQAEDVLRALDGEPNRVPTIDDAYATMELIHAIYGV